MSQSFGTLIDADGINVARIDAIRSALRKVWVFKDEDSFFYASKNGEAHMLTMSWGYSDTEPRRGFAERIARAVWEANVEYCKLRVCIQDYHDIFKFRVGDYLRMRPDAPFDSLFGQMNQTGGEKFEEY